MRLARLLGVVVLGLVVGGCGDAKKPIGAQCARNSDCQAELICVVGACREECREDRDCPDDESCEPSNVIDRRVCLPPGTERPCALASDCPEEAVCVDDLCHGTCSDDSDCEGACVDGHCEGPVVTDGRTMDAGPPPEDAGPPPACTKPELALGMIGCGAACVDPTTDPTNCGECGNDCGGTPCNAGACAPPNDECEGAVAIPIAAGPVTIVGSSIGATDSLGSCSDRRDLYYTFELTRRELVVVRASSGEARVAFVDACADMVGSCGTTTRGDVLDAGTYLFVVDAVTDDWEVTIEHVVVSDSTGRRLASGMASTPFGGSTVGAENTPGTCGAGPDRFYYWLTDADFPGGDLTASTCAGAMWDTQLELVNGDGTGSCDGGDGCGTTSYLSAPVPPGAGLHVLFVDGAGATDQGDYTVTITIP